MRKMRNIDLTKSPESHCPRFQKCSINKCPLNKAYSKLKNDSSDQSKQYKERCTSKIIRKEIGKAFGLKFEGMTNREFNATKRWGKLTEEDKNAKIGKLQNSSPVTRLINAGCTVLPKKKNKSQTHILGCENGSNDDKKDISVGCSNE